MGDDVAPPVTTVVEGGKELTAPVVEHTERITRIEEQQKQHEEKLYRELASLEERVSTASASRVEALERRIEEVLTEIRANAAKAAEEAEDVPEEAEGAVEMVTPEVQATSEPPENQRRSRRSKRKARKKKVS